MFRPFDTTHMHINEYGSDVWGCSLDLLNVDKDVRIL